MRNATILVLRLKGVATETIKNIVLAGIGKLVVVDTENVSEEDLGAGFFFRDEDVGTKVGPPLPHCKIRRGFATTREISACPASTAAIKMALYDFTMDSAHVCQARRAVVALEWRRHVSLSWSLQASLTLGTGAIACTRADLSPLTAGRCCKS